MPASQTDALSGHTPPQRLTLGQLMRLSSLWFGLQFFWVSQMMILMQERVEHFAPFDDRGAYLGWLKAFGAIVVIATQLTVGFISDHTDSRLGRRRPFIIHGVLWGCAGIVFFILAPNYWWLFAAYMLIEGTINVASVPFQSLLPDLVPEKQHARAGSLMGLNQLAGNLAGLLAVIAMEIVFAGKHVVMLGDTKPYGYVWLLVAFPLVLIGTAAIVVLGTDEKRWAQTVQAKLEGAVRTIRLLPGTVTRFARTAPTLLGCILADYRKVELRSQPNFVWLAASRFVIYLGYQTFLTYVYFYVAANLDGVAWLSSLGLDPVQFKAAILPAILLFFILGGVAGTLAAAPLAERLTKKAVIGGGMVLAGAMVVPLIFTSDVWTAVACGTLLGVGWGAFIAADWAFACTLMPKQRAGSYMGIWDVTTLMPQVLAPVIAWPIRDNIVKALEQAVGPRAAEATAHQWLYATIIVYFVVGLVLLRNVKEVRNQSTTAN